MLSFVPRDVLDDIWGFIESVSGAGWGGVPTYYYHEYTYVNNFFSLSSVNCLNLSWLVIVD